MREREESLQPSNNSELDNGHELPKPNFTPDFAKWICGTELETESPKPFDLGLEDSESIIGCKTDEERAEIIRSNHEKMLRNNEKIVNFNDRVIELSEYDIADLESMLHDEGTSPLDKSIISCVGIIYAFDLPGGRSDSDIALYDNIKKITDGFYGFDMVIARQWLKHSSRFKILTRKEREKIPAGSIEDIASAALESFVMNPNYSLSRLDDYNDYLHGIMLDCTKRKVKEKDGAKVIEEEVDSEEFQARVIESMSWKLLDNESEDRVYSEDELAKLRAQSSDVLADYRSGHYFPTDCEDDDEWPSGGCVLVDNDHGKSYRSIYGGSPPDHMKKMKKRIRSNNDEVFRYSEELANAEMRQWAEKINLDEVERINNDSDLDYEKKISSITLYMQEALDVQNLDENGQSRPINVKWFRPKEPILIKAIRELFDIPIKNEDLPEDSCGAFYIHSERSIYYPISSKRRQKLSDWMICTVAHEMWHAKQHETADNEQQPDPALIVDNRKARMYSKNFLAYRSVSPLPYPLSLPGDAMYRAQIIEREAHALDRQIEESLRIRHMKK